MFGEPGIIVLFEVSPDRLVRDAAGLGWDLPALERERKLKIIFTTRQVFRQELQQTDSLLLEEAAEIGARRIYVDGVAGAASAVGGGELRDSFHVLVEGLQRENLTAVFAVEASATDGDRRIALPEESIADTVVRLRMEERFRATVRSIEIVKSRGHDFQMGPPLVPDRRWPRARGVPAGAGAAPAEPRACRRLRSDDARVHRHSRPRCGGERRLLPRQHDRRLRDLGRRARASWACSTSPRGRGAASAASCSRWTSRSPQVIRNANSIGIDLQAHIDSGLVRLQYDAPQEMEIDVHFHNIERLVEEFKPKRVLIDSLSTYGANMGTGGRVFRDFFHALVALMKEHQTAAVYNHENPEMLGMSSMMGDFAMSSLVDNILLMNWIELGDAFRLGLTVAKMRANPNTRSTHECEILDGQGLRVLPRQIPGPRPHPFSSYQNLISRAPLRHVDRDVE